MEGLKEYRQLYGTIFSVVSNSIHTSADMDFSLFERLTLEMHITSVGPYFVPWMERDIHVCICI